MAGMTQGTRTGPRDQFVFALVLIAVGVAGLAIRLTEGKLDVGGIIVTVVGLGLLGAFAYTRHYGYLVPGGILTGLGIGIALQDTFRWSDETTGGVIVLGLGLGFVSIWVIGQVVNVQRALWWPLVPGGILSVVGGALLVGGDAIRVLDWWGIALVAIGVLVLWQASRAGHQSR